MKAFLSNLVIKINSFLQWLGSQPILEPLKELLHYQRTMVLLTGVLCFKILPWLLADLPLWLQTLTAVFIIAVLLGLFFGLQKEVLLEEAQNQVESLPATNDQYLKELGDLAIQALMESFKPHPVIVEPSKLDA